MSTYQMDNDRAAFLLENLMWFNEVDMTHLQHTALRYAISTLRGLPNAELSVEWHTSKDDPPRAWDCDPSGNILAMDAHGFCISIPLKRFMRRKDYAKRYPYWAILRHPRSFK